MKKYLGYMVEAIIGFIIGLILAFIATDLIDDNIDNDNEENNVNVENFWIINPNWEGVYEDGDFDENLILKVCKDEEGNIFTVENAEYIEK